MVYSQCHICHFLRRLLHLRRGCPVIVSGNRRRTGSEFVDGVLNLACGLLESGLLFPGKIVAITAINRWVSAIGIWSGCWLSHMSEALWSIELSLGTHCG